MVVSTPTRDSKEGVAFLQLRVAQFGLMTAVLGGIFWAFRAVVFVVLQRYQELTTASFTLHGLGIFFSLLLWILCRGAPRSRRFVERAEVVCLLSSVCAYEGMGAFIDLEQHPELIVILALTLVMRCTCRARLGVRWCSASSRACRWSSTCSWPTAPARVSPEDPRWPAGSTRRRSRQLGGR
jgi:hypothetical protein